MKDVIIEEYTHSYDEKSIIEYFSIIENKVILDSSLKSEHLGRYTIIGIEPFLFFASKNENITITNESGTSA